MTAIINRKVYEPGGFAYGMLGGKCKPLPKNVAYLINEHSGHYRSVTWDEVMEQRRKKQEQRLDLIRSIGEPSVIPCYVWTFFNRQSIPYHGWYCYVMTGHRWCNTAVNFKGFDEKLAMSIMLEIPLGYLPLKENFENWMAEFAKRFPRKHPHDPRKAGSKIGWLKDRCTFSLERPNDSLNG